VATTGGINSGDIRDLMIESVERRFGLISRLLTAIEWLSDNGSLYTAREICAREIPASRSEGYHGSVDFIVRNRPCWPSISSNWLDR
jgi:hypothetical protein